MDLAPHFTALITGLVVSLAATPAVRSLASRFNICAIPAQDRWHSRPIPLLGGIAIAIGLAAGVLITGPDRRFLPLFLYSGLMFALGVFDDIRAVKPLPKLCGQMAVAALVLWLMPPIAVTGWALLDRLLAFVWIVGVTNAFNLLDNMDGLAAGVAAIAAVCYLTLLLAGERSGLTVAIAAFTGAVLGFLVFNFPPASVFMGDSGSLLLGGFLATAGLSSTADVQNRLMPAALFPVLILLVPILDTAFVTFTRSFSGRSALAGGRDHTSHRLVALGRQRADGGAVPVRSGGRRAARWRSPCASCRSARSSASSRSTSCSSPRRSWCWRRRAGICRRWAISPIDGGRSRFSSTSAC